MLNWDKSIKDLECLRNIGVPDHEMNGYGVIDAEEFILREYHTNRREQGYDVPEKYQPQPAPLKERELKYQSMMMANLESERVDRKIENGPDNYSWCDDEDMRYDLDTKEWVPEYILEKREKERELEELQRQRMARCEEHLKEKYQRKMRNILLRERYLERKAKKA